MWLEYQISSMKYYIYMNKTAFLHHVQLQQIIAQNMNIIECSTKLFKTCLIEIGSQYAISQEFIATNLWKSTGCLWKYNNFTIKSAPKYHTSVELCTWFVLCCVLLWLGNSPIISPGVTSLVLWESYCDYVIVNMPMLFRITSLPVGQSYDCPSGSEVTQTNMVMSIWNQWIKYIWK